MSKIRNLLVGCICVYVVGAVGAANLNITEWVPTWRYVVAGIMGVVFLCNLSKSSCEDGNDDDGYY